MTEEPFKNKIKELKSELQLKNKEISGYLDKIDYLENMIMEIEDSLTKKGDKLDSSLLNIQLKDLEGKNRDLKKRMSLLRLKNVKLKQEIEKVKKGYFDASSLIQVVDRKANSNESEFIENNEIERRKDYTNQQELFSYVQITCPKCETTKSLKIPIRIINQTQNITTISIPKGMVCEDRFQILIDKSFNIKRYLVVDFDFPHLEYYESQIGEDLENITQFAPLKFFEDIITLLRRSVDDREILGAALFTKNGKVIYASVPSDILFNTINEFEFRKEDQVTDINKIFLELKNQQKICSEYIEIQNIGFFLVLILSRRVSFGMASMLFKDMKKKIKATKS